MLEKAMPAQVLLTLPPAMADSFERLETRSPPRFVALCDPPGSKLGSGGGSVHLLVEAWKRTGRGECFREWLCHSRKLIVHGGGQSRRLPAYAATGKILAPMPTWRWATGQRLGQNLLDLQAGAYERLLESAPDGIAVMIAAGDVLVDFDPPSFIPSADVIGCGLWTRAEEASRFGVFFLEKGPVPRLDFFLQKPSAAEIREFSRDRLFLIDSGIWMLSERALEALFGMCGVDMDAPAGPVLACDLYGDFAPALGAEPSRPAAAVAEL
ncbi:MAG: L-fucokinase, partial [Spirochaetaceae bacterium]|nr:L-fucokinase [Spirochaetaceae bacterium]